MSLDSIPTLPRALNVSGDDLIGIIDMADRRSPKSATLAESVNAAIAEDPAASQTAIGASATGGISKLWLSDPDGNWTSGPYNGLAGAGTDGNYTDAGNIFIPDLQGIQWLTRAGTLSGSGIFHDEEHDAFGGEMYIVSPWRIALLPKGPVQFGTNDILPTATCLHIVSGSASAAAPIKHSRAISWQTKRYNSGTERTGYFTAQATSLDADSDSSVLRFALKDELTETGTGPVEGFNGGGGTYTKGLSSGTTVAEMSESGIWSPGVAPIYDTLVVSGVTITQVCSKYKTVQAAQFTITGNWTLAFSGIEAGMRGVIYVTQDGGGSRTLTPSGGSALGLSSTAGYTDRVTWEYDGVFVNFAVTQNVQREVIISDADVSAFIAAASLTDSTQKAAVNTLVTSLKAQSLWSKFYALYPFVGGTSTAHAQDLKAAYDITWVNDAAGRHNANGVTGDVASSFYGSTGINLTTLSAQNSAFGYAYCRSATPTDGGYFFGATDTPRFGLSRSGSNLGYHGPNNTANAGWTAPGGDFTAHLGINRSSSTTRELYYNSSTSAITESSSGTPNVPIYLFARAIARPSPNGYSNANLAFSAFGQSLTPAEYATFVGIVDAYQTALGRAN